MQVDKRKWLFIGPVSLAVLLSAITHAGSTRAQQNPTPITITLTPGGGPVPVPNPTDDGIIGPDRFEPNDLPWMATPVGMQMETGLTLLDADMDYFTGYLKAGQIVRLATVVYGGLDTRLKLFWQGQLVAENDDRSSADVSSIVTWTAAVDGWFIALVEKATVYDGVYDLDVALVQPTATPTPLPTMTPPPTLPPSPTSTPPVQPDLAEPNNSPDTAWPQTPAARATYTLGVGDVDYFTFIAKAGNTYTCETVTGQVDTLLTVSDGAAVIGVNDDRGVGRVDSALTWMAAEEQRVIIKVEARGGGFGQYELACQETSAPVLARSPEPSASPVSISVVNEPVTATTASDTTPITVTGPISLTVQHIGRVQPQADAVATHIRLLVYYDANNDRTPGPGEGIANVSVLAVDAQGQRIARVFTNAQGEAFFNLNNETVARVVVPFVPGWSSRVRVGEINNDIVLGLPAVRLPVFFPVQNRPAGDE
jgi:hypothetical protein